MIRFSMANNAFLTQPKGLLIVLLLAGKLFSLPKLLNVGASQKWRTRNDPLATSPNWVTAVLLIW